MLNFFKAAVENVYRHGDTDIFPFPIENRIMHDSIDEFSGLALEYFEKFDEEFQNSTPSDIRSIVPIHHSGFRWATQLDPIWNVIFLAGVLSIAQKIERARLSSDVVFSYRLDEEEFLKGTIFRKDVSWSSFCEATALLADEHDFVVTCDIADCYSRIGHHKLDNALRLIDAPAAVRKMILEYIKLLTGTRSSGLPIGGPAARILAELSLNNVDQYMYAAGIKFVRYADDYHFFCSSRKVAYEVLVKLHGALDNEGLTLQKSKTRILSKFEFRAVNSVISRSEHVPDTPAQRLMSLSLRFDPYATDAEAQYELLKGELGKIDITALLNEQLSQTRIHIPTTRKIIEALRLLRSAAQFGAVLSMLDNMDSLYPIAASVFQTVFVLMDEFDDAQREQICDGLTALYEAGHEVMSIPSHVAFSNRVISKHKSVKNQYYLTKVFEEQSDVLVRRDIIMIFSNWMNFPWLSMYRAKFSSASPWERRAFIMASYSMADEGRHWRDHARGRFDKFETLVRDWRAKRPQEALPL
jgi:hypothetical protein